MTEAVCAPRLQMQMSQGKSRNQTELYKCICPPCFFELEEGGKKSCVPKGNLDLCDLPSGVYSNPGTAGGCCGFVTMWVMQPSCLLVWCCRGSILCVRRHCCDWPAPWALYVVRELLSLQLAGDVIVATPILSHLR